MTKYLDKYDFPICAIQEHRFIYNVNYPEIISKSLGRYTLFTASAWKAANNATGVAEWESSSEQNFSQSCFLLERIIIADFRGNLKPSIISCYSRHNGYEEDEIEASTLKCVTDHYDTQPSLNLTCLQQILPSKSAKRKVSLWTWRLPNGNFSQID